MYDYVFGECSASDVVSHIYGRQLGVFQKKCGCRERIIQTKIGTVELYLCDAADAVGVNSGCATDSRSYFRRDKG